MATTKAKKKTAKTKKANGGNKSAKVISMLRRKSGATREQILAATGWKAVSPAAIARGLQVIVDVEQRPYRYRISGS